MARVPNPAVIVAVAAWLSWPARGAVPPPIAPASAPGVVAGASAALDPLGHGRRYDVCSTCKFHELTDVPWERLGPGAVVNIFAREQPYRTKIALRVSGTARAHIVINGVADASGHLPVISGDDAVTARDNVNSGVYLTGHPEYGESLAVILIKRSSEDPYGYRPSYLELRHLVIRDSYGKSYIDQTGRRVPYSASAAGIWADVVDDLTIEDCEITNNAFGIFVNTKNANGNVDAETSHNVVVRHSRIYGNGRVGSYYEHNLYLQGIGCTLDSSFVGTLRPGAEGSSYKDRCAGSVITNNHIEAAARALDLVHDESGSAARRDSPTTLDPRYDRALVDGNTIIANGAVSCIHWGGDNLGDGAGPFPTYRNGPLVFTNNTCTLSTNEWRAAVIEIQQVAGTAEASGNTILFTGKSHIRSWLALYGTLQLAGANATQALADASDRADPSQYKVIRR